MAARLHLVFALCAPLASACAGLEPEDSDRVPLPDRWDTCEPFAFEELLANELPGDAIVYFNRDGYRDLTAALDAMDATSVRAALLLAHSRHPKAAKRLLARLEQRAVGPNRAADAGDVVAAASLGTFPDARELYLPDLVKLSAGRRPHPDLEVRVECAATCLALGDDTAIPFLLQVLRIDTYAGRSDERDFEAGTFTAWSRGRAAQALSRRAGVPVTYQADGSIAQRERETTRLEELLLAALSD